MNNLTVKRLILLTIIGVFAFTLNSNAQSFEGTIEFIQVNSRDTLEWAYHIKGNKVRIESQKGEKITGIYLVDFDKRKNYALNTTNKLYMEMPYKSGEKGDDSKFEVVQTGNKKTLLGYECSQWRVTNKEENTVVQYWVAGDNFDFFQKLMSALDRKEKAFRYFKQFDNTAGMFPLLAEERTMLREDKSKLLVQKIDAKKLDKSLFEIPKDYRLHTR